ncbi:sulfotransferase [Spirulina major]|uniref:sulfotransferase n=1 Tax=Spirulina major TaxID=270636 RepID=UPI000932CE53|nr:sulfotransferase [Spirulina major]
MRINKKVCFITGTGHSGSTLLGLLLGNHSQSFYCGEGEKSRFLTKEKAPLQKRSCKFCGIHCPVWGTVSLTSDCDLYEQLSQHISTTLGITAPLMIDSTSGADWIHQQYKKLVKTEAKPHLIFLKRDGRGVVNSYRRKYPDLSIETIIENWIEKIKKAQALFEEFAGPKIIIHYEELASNTTSILKGLCDFLTIPHEPQMRDFSRQTYHILGGNNGTQFLAARHQSQLLQTMTPSNRQYYQEHQSDIILDLRWQQELSPEQHQIFARLASEVNQSFEWHPS